jgi:hypothetical protein
MVKLIDSTGEIFVKGETILDIIKKLNDDQNGSNEWRYYYRPDYGVVNAYFNTDLGEFDAGGEKADVTYDVIND